MLQDAAEPWMAWEAGATHDGNRAGQREPEAPPAAAPARYASSARAVASASPTRRQPGAASNAWLTSSS